MECNDLVEVRVQSFPSAVNAPKLKEKLQWLQTTFQCFKGGSSHEWKRHKVHQPSSSHHQQRPKIGSKELDCEVITKKEVTSLMNKLTTTNKDHICKQLKATLREQFVQVYVDTIWDFMLMCPDQQSLYTDVLLQLSCHIDVKSALKKIIDEYVSSKGWVPHSFAVGSVDYDEFCDTVKWKKHAIAKIKAIALLCRKQLLHPAIHGELINRIIDDSRESSREGMYNQFEVYIELLLASPNIPRSYDQTICEWKNVATSLNPSLRFKIYDLYERQNK